jgi:hypothetical protein
MKGIVLALETNKSHKGQGQMNNEDGKARLFVASESIAL